MRRPNLLIGSFLLTIILVDLTVVAFRPEMHGPGWCGALLWGLYLSQVSLTAIWLGLGRPAAPLRTVATFFVLIEWNAAIFFVTNETEDLYRGFLLTGMVTALVAIPIMATRLLGLRLACLHNGELRELSPQGPERFQFSILYMFGLMTTLAVVLGMLQFMFICDYVQFRDLVDWWLVVRGIGFHGLIAWAALWLLLDRRPMRTAGRMLCSRLTWLIVLLVAIICVTVGLWRHNRQSLASGTYIWNSYYYSPPPPYSHCYGDHAETSTVTQRMATEGALLLGSLWVFRLAGYRVVFRRPIVTERQIGAETGAKEQG